MGMELAVDFHASPTVGDDLDVGGMDVWVFRDKVVCEDGAEEFWWVDWVLLCGDVDCVLDCVCGDDDTVVCSGVSGDGEDLLDLV